MNVERCCLCGRIIPEGSQVCAVCTAKYAPIDPGAAGVEVEQELRDIAAVLKITANSDGNIKSSMEALLRIADRLERKRKCQVENISPE